MDNPTILLTYRAKLQSLFFDLKGPMTSGGWDETLHPRDESGKFGTKDGGTESTEEHGEYYQTPSDAVQSLLNKEPANIAKEDVRAFLKQAAEHKEKHKEETDLTDLHVDGKLIFGGNGLGIPREEMPQIPKELREKFLNQLREGHIKITKEYVDPHDLAPTQRDIGAGLTLEKLDKYDADKKRPFPPILVAQDNHVLDGHHHYAAMLVTALDHPGARIPIYRVHTNVPRALAAMNKFDKDNKIEKKKAGQNHDVVAGRLDLDYGDLSLSDREALEAELHEWQDKQHDREH